MIDSTRRDVSPVSSGVRYHSFRVVVMREGGGKADGFVGVLIRKAKPTGAHFFGSD